MHQSPENLDALEVMEPPFAERENSLENRTSRAWAVALLVGLFGTIFWLLSKTGGVIDRPLERLDAEEEAEEAPSPLVESPIERRTPRLWPFALLLGLVLWLFTT